MELRDVELIEKHGVRDERLKALYDEHLDFERQLEKYNSKSFLSPSEELERKRLQKMKLKGRDQLEEILKSYRKNDFLS